ncbi:MAG: Na+ dependent nucleoside transporter N-terminal domain-containing protein [Planctomycetota bacterium]
MERLISLLGRFVMIGLAWLMSSHKRRISPRIIGGGPLLQFTFGVLPAILVFSSLMSVLYYFRVRQYWAIACWEWIMS